MDQDSTRADEFSNAIKEYAPRYNVRLTTTAISRLREYYEQVMAWNTRLHLVAPCSPAEFATRHVLESLFPLAFLPEEASIVDIGSGAGLPAIPWLTVRTDLRVTFIESSQKKAVFLREALRRLDAHDKSLVIAERFEKMPAPEAEIISCRALDRFTEMFPKILEWSPHARTLVLFGGVSLREQIENITHDFKHFLIPDSERRFVFLIRRGRH
jgi:16S rRNA (guanine527-N7)-methyltransferase